MSSTNFDSSSSPNFPLPIIDSNTSAPQQQTNGSSTGATLQSTKDQFLSTASSAMSSVQNHPVTQQTKDTIVNGPVGQAVQNQGAKTSSEFQDLANAKTIPDQPAATGQPLTAYHSLFYRLLSWKNPRATGIVFASVVTFIFASRYLDFLRYTLKGLYTVLGITAAAEIAGKVAFNNGFATQLRPKQYFTIRKESLERFTEDIEQLINFVVIEFQRIVFVENIWVTVGAFLSSFISYFLIKLLPFWGLTLLGTVITFLGPLVYIQNKDFIDEHINHAGNVIKAQSTQVRDLAAHHTNQASESVRSYAGEYSQKAQQMISDARGKAANGSVTNNIKSKIPSSISNNTSFDAPKTSSSLNSSSFDAPQTSSSLNNSSFDAPKTSSTLNSHSFPDAPQNAPFPSAPQTEPFGTKVYPEPSI